MSADRDHSMGQPARDDALDWEMADLAAPEEPGWYADDALAIDETAWETTHEAAAWKPRTSMTRPGKPLTSMTLLTRARPRAPRSLMVAGPMRWHPIQCWPRWSISSSAMGWRSWMMIS